ncbi:hypothetical protein [Streptomyces niveiscabiei]|uniref:Uncharacterized protein n=1 Tax=Streptomyces niveiscabiei TaxID=164115 RepID=A0ABW9I369_9ACTN
MAPRTRVTGVTGAQFVAAARADRVFVGPAWFPEGVLGVVAADGLPLGEASGRT